MKKEIKKFLTEEEIRYIEEKLEFKFQKKHLLQQAFTRKSLGVEYNIPYNGPLKIIGDDILRAYLRRDTPYEIATSESLFNPDIPGINPFDNYHEFLENIKDNGYKTIEQYFNTLDIVDMFIPSCIEYLMFDNLILMNETDKINGVAKNNEVLIELLKSILAAVAIDPNCNWDFNILSNVYKNIVNEDRVMLMDIRRDVVEFIDQWYFKMCKQFVPYNYEYDSNLKEYFCSTEINIDNNYSLNFNSNGKTKKEARRICAIAIFKYLKSKEYFSKNKTLEIELRKLKEDGSNAINLLQELSQKGLVPTPNYEFKVEYDDNGNPEWKCDLDLSYKTIDEPSLIPHLGYTSPFEQKIYTDKKAAKKAAAKHFLSSLNCEIKRLQGVCDIEIFRVKNDTNK